MSCGSLNFSNFSLPEAIEVPEMPLAWQQRGETAPVVGVPKLLSMKIEEGTWGRRTHGPGLRALPTLCKPLAFVKVCNANILLGQASSQQIIDSLNWCTLPLPRPPTYP